MFVEWVVLIALLGVMFGVIAVIALFIMWKTTRGLIDSVHQGIGRLADINFAMLNVLNRITNQNNTDSDEVNNKSFKR